MFAFRTKSLRTPSNMFVVNLALSDLTFSAVNGFPLLTISAFSRRWIFGKIGESVGEPVVPFLFSLTTSSCFSSPVLCPPPSAPHPPSIPCHWIKCTPYIYIKGYTLYMHTPIMSRSISTTLASLLLWLFQPASCTRWWARSSA